MENFLLTAKIVEQRSLSVGITGSERASTLSPASAELGEQPEYWLLLAEGHLNRRLFGDMLGRIWALPLPSG